MELEADVADHVAEKQTISTTVRDAVAIALRSLTDIENPVRRETVAAGMLNAQVCALNGWIVEQLG